MPVAGGVDSDGGTAGVSLLAGGAGLDSTEVVGGVGAVVEIVEVTSVVVSIVVGVVSVTTLGVGVVSTTGGTAGLLVAQSVTVTVTVAGPDAASRRIVSHER